MIFSGSNSFNSHNLGNSENGVTPLRQGKSFSLCQAHPHPALCHPRGPCGLRRHVLRADWLRRPRCMENFRPIAVDNGPFMDNLWWFTDENGWFSIANGWSTGKIWFFWASEENEEPSRKCGIHQVGWVERRFLKNWRWTSQKLIVHLIAWPETLKKTGSSFLKPSPKSDSRVFVFKGWYPKQVSPYISMILLPKLFWDPSSMSTGKTCAFLLPIISSLDTAQARSSFHEPNNCHVQVWNIVQLTL